jgi:hypothetical protein
MVKSPPSKSVKRESARLKTTLAVFCFVLVTLFAAEVIIDDSCPVPPKFSPVDKEGVRPPRTFVDDALRTAFTYYRNHLSQIRNKRYLTIIDYTKPSYTRRLFLFDLETCRVEKFYVAHGKNSGYVYADHFSNEVDSWQSSKGFFLTGGTFGGTHGTCLVLRGLQRGINDRAEERGIVLHGAEYVTPTSIRLNGGRLGRSLGCPAVSMDAVDEIVQKIKQGSLLYIHTNS